MSRNMADSSNHFHFLDHMLHFDSSTPVLSIKFACYMPVSSVEHIHLSPSNWGEETIMQRNVSLYLQVFLNLVESRGPFQDQWAALV